MEYDGRYDNPKYITAFLAGLRITDEELAQNVNDVPEQLNKEDKVEDSERPAAPRRTSGNITPGLMSAASSPPVGTRAPPPTPEYTMLAAVTTEHLPPIDEHPDTNRANKRGMHQQDGAAKQFRSTAHSFRPFGKEQPNSSPESLSVVDSDTLLKHDVMVQNYHENALKKFLGQAKARVALRNSANQSKEIKNEHITDKAIESLVAVETQKETLSVETQMNDGPADNEYRNNGSSVSTGTFRDAQDESTAISDGSEDDDASINIIVDAPKTPDSFKAQKATIVIASPDKTPARTGHDTASADDMADVRTATKEKQQIAIKEEPRDDAVYFANWGTPSTRTTAPARVRKVILNNIPPSADLNLVQSLVHGGSIETMTLSQASTGNMSAFVTFTDADACDFYFDAYPNGLEYKYKGKKYVTYVNKGQNVDVVSGVLRSYLECGASRVVKAVNADEDWSLRALYKIAEGSTTRRKVEAVVDTYRHDIRIIIFRFTNIADAVTFRGQLLRDPEWEDIDIQFMADPCEKATGIHWN